MCIPQMHIKPVQQLLLRTITRNGFMGERTHLLEQGGHYKSDDNIICACSKLFYTYLKHPDRPVQ